jgi:hydrogenase nickel incorporation protein HypB
LICPIEFQLGAHQSVLIASTPEGADKPCKYPRTYRGVQVLVVNKIDLLPYVAFDVGYFQCGVASLNPGVHTFPLSCRTGEGVADWPAWVVAEVENHHPIKHD